MRTACFLLLLLPSLAFAAEPVHVAVARDFRRAFDAKDIGSMAILAAKPAREIPYALVVFSLLESRQFEAAKKLVELRAGAPEAAGLQNLLKGYQAGIVANDRERALWRRAEQALNDRKPDEALDLLKAAGKPRPGTVTGARMEWARSVAHGLKQEWEATVASMREAARLARMVGWLQQSLMVDSRRLRIARQHPALQKDAVAAAAGVIQDAQALANREAWLNGLLARATIYAKHGNVKEARADYAAALQKARELGLYGVAGRILTNLGSLAQTFERQPERARRHYEDAITAFERAGDTKSIPSVRLNLAIALTSMGKYDDALARLDELDRSAGSLARASRSQRAYIRRRQGRIERSRTLYRELYDSAKTPRERRALGLDLGELELVRGDFRAALAHFAPEGDESPAGYRALAGAAAALGGLQRLEACREKFAASVAAAPTPEEKGRVELQWSSFERSFGDLEAAIARANSARGRLARKESTDYANGAASWVVTGDLLLLDGQRTEALKPLANASVFFAQLQDVSRAIPAYARETLVLMGIAEIGRYLDEVEERRGTLLQLGEGTRAPALRSMVATVDGIYLHKRGKPEEGNKRFAEAAQVAREARLPEREATALSMQALFAGAGGLEAALRAAALRERRPERSIELRPFVLGENADGATSIALRALLAQENPDPALALQLIEASRADALELGLRGRDAILVRQLDERDYRSYVEKRAALREARATGEGADEAAAVFRAELERLRPAAPLAFASLPKIATVQQALRDDELLLLYLDDPYVSCLLAVDSKQVLLRAFDPAKPLEGVEPLLAAKKTLIIAPGGFLSLDAVRWGDGVLCDAFSIRYCASAANLLAQRERAAPAERAPVRVVAGPTRVGLVHPQATDADLSRKEPARVVVYGGVEAKPGPGATPTGLACLATPRLLAGADFVLVSSSGEADATLIERFRTHVEKDGKSAPEALALVRAWARTQPDRKDPQFWATLVLWGAP